MTTAQSATSDDALPPSRIVRWVLLGGVILFSVGLYFRFGLHVPPIGTVPPPAATTTTP
ncbi:MAG TPA: hypothetical protein VGQ48_05710 [Gemmatimonadales bacterium]|nr:hypothetical protein [Gemmatimonadales bacterium]